MSPSLIIRCNHKKRIISPNREELEKLQGLSPVDRQILDLFDARLAPKWEIYVRPHMNGVCPDFVLLNPEVGSAVFKISKLENPSQGEIKIAQDIAAQWKKDILNLYCPRLGAAQKQGDYDSGMVITAGVIFPKNNTSLRSNSKYYPVSSGFDIIHENIGKIFPNHHYRISKFMTPEFAEDLRGWLTFPDFMSDSITPLDYKMLDSKQKELINRDRTKSGYRRIRGAAGSGKSLILAIRAAKLAIEGKKVLIATYNITLWHYLRDLIIRALKAEFENAKQRAAQPRLPKSHKIKLNAKSFAEYFRVKAHNPPLYPQGENYNYEHLNNQGELSVSDWDNNPLGNITFTHFHYWCKSVCCYEAQQPEKYTNLPWIPAPQYVLDNGLSSLTLSLKRNFPPNYDAILLDEGQDYRPLWWQALHTDLKPDGEAMLVADRTQDIYGHGAAWTEEAMVDAGFTGRWNVLSTSYRIPENLRQLAEIFVKAYIQNPDKILPEAKPTPQGAFFFSNSILRWTQISSTAQEYCLEEMNYLLSQTGTATKLANADIIICVDSIGFGTALRDALRNKDIEVFDTFHDSHHADDQTRHKESKAKKMAFYLEGKTLPSYQNPARLKTGKAAVKITTIHSFKGYEAPIMLLYLENSEPELFYAAFTRIKERAAGSIFSIVCADSNFRKFGEKFPEHGGKFFDKTGFNIQFNRGTIPADRRLSIKELK